MKGWGLVNCCAHRQFLNRKNREVKCMWHHQDLSSLTQDILKKNQVGLLGFYWHRKLNSVNILFHIIHLKKVQTMGFLDQVVIFLLGEKRLNRCPSLITFTVIFSQACLLYPYSLYPKTCIC